MKIKLFSLLLAISVLQVWGQTYSKSVISSTQSNGAFGLVEFDVNNDGHMDLITTAKADNTVAYQLNNGNSTFTQHIIDNNLQNAVYAFANDLDNDNDLDFVAIGDSELVWYENDGSFNFTKHSIANITNPSFVVAYDIDDDGDGDIGVAISGENYITAFLNGGSANFTRVNGVSVDNPKMFFSGDFNNDGTADLLIPSFDDDSIEWYYFNGMFFVQGGTITNNFDGVWWAEGSDLNGDDYWDVVAAAYNGNKISWFENDGTGNSYTEHVIDNNINQPMYLRVKDLNGDSYLDIVATGHGSSGTGSEVSIYINDGNQNFTKTTIDNTEQGPTCVSPQDFTGDGNIDIAFAAELSNQFLLLTNTTNSIQTVDNEQFEVYPNPAKDFIKITAEKPVKDIVLYDLTGRAVLKTTAENIDVASYMRGYYLLQVTFENGNRLTRKILLR